MAEHGTLESQIPVVIPVFNGWGQTRTCLDHLRASTYPHFQVIVVDHGSTDKTKTELPRDYPEVIHLRGDPSLWWTGATNLGIRWALDRGARAVMLLNNDSYVEPETIGTIAQHARTRPDAIIAPVQKDNATGVILSVTADTFYLLGFTTFRPRRTVPRRCSGQVLCPTRLIIGGRGVLIPALVFARIGLLDDKNLPHYGSDNDLYLRARSHGFSLFIATDTAVQVDRRRTTLADRLGPMTWRNFLRTLCDRRSHRNIRDLVMLFRRHYPIPGLYLLGVALNLMRYFGLYLAARTTFLLRR